MIDAAAAMLLSMLLVEPDAVFRPPVSSEGALGPAALDRVQKRIDARVTQSSFELTVPQDASRCDALPCWQEEAAESGARYILGVRLDATQSDQSLAVTVTDLSDGTEVVQVTRTCELCGRTELEDLTADATATAIRKLESYASIETTLVIDSVPPGATVRIDGVEVGTTPLDIEATPGEHVVELLADGFAPVEQAVDVERGMRERLRLVMAEEAPPAPIVEPPAPTDTGPTRRRGRVIASAALLGSGVAAVGAGVALLVLHGRPITGKCSGANVDADGDCQFLRDTRLGGAVALGVGVAASAAGGVLLGLELRRGRDASLTVAPSPMGATVSGRF
ncbi:MAG: PEGA domain-containing protein [Nannocystaceae bacterium]|nr:PEGA domain-containing protein [bacterium]